MNKKGSTEESERDGENKRGSAGGDRVSDRERATDVDHAKFMKAIKLFSVRSR